MLKKRVKRFVRSYLSPVLKYITPPIGWLWLMFIRVSSKFELHGFENRIKFDKSDQGYLIAFWHNRQIVLPLVPNTKPMHVLISTSRDGNYVSGMTHLFGKKTIRGSTSKGGMKAMLEMMRVLRAGQVAALSPDGPRGPAFEVKPGIIQLAQSLQLPILPISFDNNRKKVLKSWDSFFLPKPFGKICIAMGEPMYVSHDQSIEHACDQLANALNKVGDTAAYIVSQ